MLLAPKVAPYACRCGVVVRTVPSNSGGLITINEEPTPDGDLIPWPSQSTAGMAVARRISVPVTDGPMWQEHDCPYTRYRESGRG
jgi:hypothetical protein